MDPNEAVAQLARMPEHTGAGTCFGTPVAVGDRIVIPIAEVVYGFGFGWGSGGNEAANADEYGTGGGGGGGTKARGVAVIEVSPGGVQIHPVRDRTAIALAQLALASSATALISRTLVKLIRG
ncbi:MAG: spore germination protein GerW family protein [Chloroflexi bacterium]|nr:spore germination protein GerW family protein [Chloroflexota bacterium]MDA1145928.1 spore germination protein GerW family protein [Chloroflexota bacterium]